MGSYRLKYRINGKEDIFKGCFLLKLVFIWIWRASSQLLSESNKKHTKGTKSTNWVQSKEEQIFDILFKTLYPEKQEKWVLANWESTLTIYVYKLKHNNWILHWKEKELWVTQRMRILLCCLIKFWEKNKAQIQGKKIEMMRRRICILVLTNVL